MIKRDSWLAVAFAAALLSLLLGSSGVSAALFGCDDDSDCSDVWEVNSGMSGCNYGFECAGNWWSASCRNPSTETCAYSVGTTYDSFGDGYIVVCDNGGCNYVLTTDCNIQDGCANNLYEDYYYNYDFGCDKSTSCQDQCCPTGQKCDGGVCKKPIPCEDKDSDTYQVPKSGFSASDCTTTIDCDDANANIYPGSCSSSAVSWSSSCSTSGTGGCGSGTCVRALPSGCGDVCGDSKVTGTEGCDWGSGSVWGNGVWAPKWVSCPGGYDQAYGQYTCKTDCSGLEYDYVCQSCGDGTCNGPETKATCAADCGKCGNGVTDSGEVCDPGSLVTGSKTQSCGSGYPSVTATCKSDCSGYDYVCQSCGDSTVNGPEVCEAGQTKACPGGGTVSCKSLTCEWRDCPVVPCAPPLPLCTKQQGVCSGSSKCTGICDDTDYQNYNPNYQNAETKCDSLDNDCDGSVDEGCAVPCADGVKNGGEAGVDCGGTCPVPDCSKSVGVCTGKVKTCSASGWVDCSEAGYGANPNYQSAEITCDNLDNDCDGSVDEGCDDDNDEFCDSSMTWSGTVLSGTCAVASAGDCNDANAAINPGAVDVCGNGVDEDCSWGDAACPVLDPCAGVEKDSSQSCCAAAGFQWVKSGEANVGQDNVDNQFQDSRGERKATSKLLPNEYRCFGDDADEQFFVRTRDCKAGVCTSSAADKSLCDKLSDCVYSGKCYSDIEAVASTFFGGSVGAVWSSSWQKEVTADVNGDGKLEVCDPGEWQSPAGAVAGAVRNISTSNGDGPCPVGGCPVAGALVKVLGTSPLLSATTAADGSYSIADVPLGTYDLTASRPVDGYEDSAVLNQELVSGAVTVGFTLVRARGGCEDDCTKVGSNRCDAGCHGKGLCWFYNGAAKAACDGTFGIVDVPGGQAVECCKGRPYTLIKADVTVKAKQVIKTVRPVLYKGRLVKLVTLLFIPEK